MPNDFGQLLYLKMTVPQNYQHCYHKKEVAHKEANEHRRNVAEHRRATVVKETFLDGIAAGTFARRPLKKVKQKEEN